jgi:hypothetical protein
LIRRRRHQHRCLAGGRAGGGAAACCDAVKHGGDPGGAFGVHRGEQRLPQRGRDALGAWQALE